MDICVDELERIGSARGRGRERSSIELAMKTRLADRIWRGLCIESHACDKIASDDALGRVGTSPEGRVGTKTCFTSEFLHCRSSSSGVLLRSGVGRAFATSGAVFASLLGPVLCVLRCCDFGSAVAMAGGLGVTWERAEVAGDDAGSAGGKC